MRRYVLKVPLSHREYAIAHGAQFDASTNTFYVDGDVPESLESFSQTKPDRKTLPRQAFPRCAQCGSRMVEQYSEADEAWVWVCVSHPRAHRILKRWNPALFSSLDASLRAGLRDQAGPTNKPNTADLFKVVSKACDVLGKRCFQNWLFEPNSALGSRRPADLLNCKEGVNEVLKLLASIGKASIRKK